MPKTYLKDILKSGDTLNSKDVDFKSRKVRERFKGIKIDQENSLKRKEVDWLKLSTFEIKI